MKYGESAVTEVGTAGGPGYHCPLIESHCSSKQIFAWRDCWRRQIMTKSCSGTWRHYWARLHVYAARMKILQRKLSEARKRKKRTNPLRILAEASLTHHGTDQPWSSIKMWKFWEFWSILEIFCKITGFCPWSGLTPGETTREDCSEFWKLGILERACKEKNYQYLGEAWFWDLSLQKLKIHQKNDFLPTFWVAERCLGRIDIWGVKSTPNSEIPVGLESRLTELSNELSYTWFGH